MNDIILNFSTFLGKWQTLIGATFGGVIGLLAALIVAHDARRRDECSAAMLLTVDLSSVLATEHALDEKIKSDNIQDKDKAQFTANLLMCSMPALSPMHEISQIKVMIVDVYLSAHLSLFQTFYKDITRMVNELSEAAEIKRKTGTDTLSPGEIKTKVNLIERGFRKACDHSRCSQVYINKFILGRFPTFSKLLRVVKFIVYDKECRKLLKNG